MVGVAFPIRKSDLHAIELRTVELLQQVLDAPWTIAASSC
jgi:hypothetical protein